MEKPLHRPRTSHTSGKYWNNANPDYAKLPRSSGDGMENDGGKADEHDTTNNLPPESKLLDMSSHSDAIQRTDGRTRLHTLPMAANAPFPIDSLENVSFFDDNLLKQNSAAKGECLEREAKCLDLNRLIKELEEKNHVLTTENERLTQKLSGQTKVNADLKKLLVASVGEDVGVRIEELVNERSKFDMTVTSLETELEEISEEFNRVSIECDVWRSKFLASRMMSSGLADVKTTLFTKHRNCQIALQKLLEEQSDIRQHLRATNRLLQAVYQNTVAGKVKNNSCWQKAFQEMSIIELSHVNNNLVEDICLAVDPVRYYQTIDNSSTGEEVIPLNHLTPAEKLACHVLRNDREGNDSSNPALQRMDRQYLGNGYASRFLTNTFRLTFDCCERCTGVLQVV